MRSQHPDLVPYVRGYNTAKDFIEALVVERTAAGAPLAHIRDTKAQWAEADGGAGAVDAIFTRFEDGSLRLKDTTNTLFTRTNHPNNVTDLNRANPIEAAVLEWFGSEPNDVEMLRVKFWLNPVVSAAQPREVAKWRLEILALTDYTPTTALVFDRFDGVYAPLAEPLDVTVTSDSAGEVTFDYSTRTARPRPKSVVPRLGVTNFVPGTDSNRPPTTLFIVYALNANGGTASNVAMGVNDGETSFTDGSGQKLQRRRFTVSTDRVKPWDEDNTARGVPHLVIENGTYTAQTITFSSGNLFDLGAAPTKDVELVGITQTPPGTSVTLEVRNAADSGWVAFTNGQFESADLGLTLIQSKKMRATLTPNGAGNVTPTLRKLGRQAIDRIDFSRVATIQGYEQAFDPETHKVEIPRPRLVAVKDGPRDFSSKIEKLLAQNFINDIRIRWYVGDSRISRSKWTHMDDFLVLDGTPRQPVIELQLVGICALLKDLAPPFSPGTSYAPDGDHSVGSYTTLAGGGSNLYQGIDETVADQTDGARSGTSPSNQEYVFNFPTPTDTAGRRMFLDVDYSKDASGGEQIDVKFRVYRNTSLVMESSLFTDIGPNRVQRTFELSEAQIADLSTDLPNLKASIITNAPSPGTGRRAQLYWARFRTGGRREVVSYSGSTLKAAYDDLLQNRLAIPANLRGPGIENAVDTVTKQITGLRKRSPGAKDVVAKTEVEALAFLADMAIGSSAGKIAAFDLSAGQVVRAVFPSRRIKIGEASAGLERRIPEYFGGYRWNAEAEEFKDEVRAFHTASLLKIGTVGLGPPKWWDEEVGKWVDSDALAERVVKRVVDRLGTGTMLWSFESVDRYNELEVCDMVAVETDLFVGRNPNLDIEVRGRRYAIGPLQRVGSGRFFTIHPRGYADIVSVADAGTRIGLTAPILEDAHALYALRHLYVNWRGNQDVASVKIATSTSSFPAAGTGTAYEGRTGSADTGSISYNTPTFVTATPYTRPAAAGVAGQPINFVANYAVVDPLLIDPTTGKTDPAGSTSRFRAKATRGSAYSTTSGSAVALPFDTEDFDNGGLHDTGSNTDRLTVPTGGDVGMWLVVGFVEWAANANGLRSVALNRAGTTKAQQIDKPFDGINTVSQIVVALENAPSVSSSWSLNVFQDSGGNLNINASSWFAAIQLW